MGLFKALRGTDLTPDEEQAIKSLEVLVGRGGIDPPTFRFSGGRSSI